MEDLVALAVISGFFGLVSVLLFACDRIVGTADAEVDRHVNADDVIGLVIASVVAIYLIVALIKPEKF